MSQDLNIKQSANDWWSKVKAGYQVIDKVVLIDLAFLHKPNNIKSLIKYE